MTLEELVLHYDSLKGLAIQEPDVVGLLDETEIRS